MFKPGDKVTCIDVTCIDAPNCNYLKLNKQYTINQFLQNGLVELKEFSTLYFAWRFELTYVKEFKNKLEDILKE